MNKKHYILDASAFINGFEPINNLNYTVPEITSEIKDFKSKIALETNLNEGKIKIQYPEDKYRDKLAKTIKRTGDDIRLSEPDKLILSLALEFYDNKKDTVLITDDYSIQNAAKILNIPFKSILTEGVKEIYTWKKTCEGCKKEYPSDYEDDICEICGSKIFKRRRRH